MRWSAAVGVVGFYARVAQTLRGNPDHPLVVVTRGQVIDASGAALAGGARLGSPAARVTRDCPGVHVVEMADLQTEAATAGLGRTMLAQTPWVQAVAPHQLLLGLGSAPAPPVVEARQIQAAAATHGQGAAIALTTVPAVARVALQLALREWLAGKGDGLLTVPAGEEAAFLAPLPLGWLPLPADMLARVSRLGLSRIGQVAEVEEAYWVRQFGPMGRELHRLCSGCGTSAVVGTILPRSVAADQECAGMDVAGLQGLLGRWAECFATELGRTQEGATRLTLTLQAEGGRQLTAARAFDRPRQEAYALRQSMVQLLTELLAQLQPGDGTEVLDQAPTVTRLAVEWSRLESLPLQQMQLLGARSACFVDPPEQRLEKALSLLQSRYPARVVGIGPRRVPSRREAMLAHLDPLRWQRGGDTVTV